MWNPNKRNFARIGSKPTNFDLTSCRNSGEVQIRLRNIFKQNEVNNKGLSSFYRKISGLFLQAERKPGKNIAIC
jgi:hypothetical protein